MNEIERKFYDAFIDEYEPDIIQAQVPIGIYVADFVLFKEFFIPSVIEIDGHDWHKTKEQRFADYQKERFFMKNGYMVIRFMGSEVFVDSKGCAETAYVLALMFSEKLLHVYEDGLHEGAREQRHKLGLEGIERDQAD